jgi:hypothetical protein
VTFLDADPNLNDQIDTAYRSNTAATPQPSWTR